MCERERVFTMGGCVNERYRCVPTRKASFIKKSPTLSYSKALAARIS